MNLEATRQAARAGRLYPGLILDGGSPTSRQEAAVELARILLCEEQSGSDRPCGRCRHCHRIAWPAEGEELFHPDFRVLERDKKTVTSVEATKSWLAQAQVRPFEARGQVFVIANAETLSAGACNAILKTLEEPPTSAPRNFLLLTPSRLDLLPTIRSRSLSVYLGSGELLDEETVAESGRQVGELLGAFAETGSGVYLLAVGEILASLEGFEDPRAERPWSTAARVVLEQAKTGAYPASLRAGLTELAGDFLEAPSWRLRAVPQRRIFDGLLARRLAGKVDLERET